MSAIATETRRARKSTRSRSIPRIDLEVAPPRRMWTVDLYVARIFLVCYGICAVSFIGLFVSIEAFAKLDRFLRQDGSLLSTLFRYHLAMVPTVYTHYVGPILTAAAGMFTVTLLNREREIAVLKASGVSTYRILAPIFVIAAILVGVTFWMQERVLPEHRGAIRTALAFSRGRPLQPGLLYDAERGLSIRVAEYSTTRRVGTQVEILNRHDNLGAKTKVLARQMEWIPTGGQDGSEGYWLLRDGSVQRWDENGDLSVNPERDAVERLKTFFKTKRLNTTLRPLDLETSDLDTSYLSWNELRTQYQRQPHHRHLEVKLHLHFAFPLAHVLLLLLAVPIVIGFENRSVLIGVGVSVLIGAAFYLLSSICMSVAQDSIYFSPILAAWLPVMLFGALGITLFDHIPT